MANRVDMTMCPKYSCHQIVNQPTKYCATLKTTVETEENEIKRIKESLKKYILAKEIF